MHLLPCQIPAKATLVIYLQLPTSCLHLNKGTHTGNTLALYHTHPPTHTQIVSGYAELGFVHIMLNQFQPLRHQFSQDLLPPQYNLCPRLQIQDTEVGLRHTQKHTQRDDKFQTSAFDLFFGLTKSANTHYFLSKLHLIMSFKIVRLEMKFTKNNVKGNWSRVTTKPQTCLRLWRSTPVSAWNWHTNTYTLPYTLLHRICICYVL